MVKVDWIRTNQTRLAENEADFETIWQRELVERTKDFQAKHLAYTTETTAVLKQEVAHHVKELEELHKDRSNYQEKDIEVLTLANSFLAYMQKGSTISTTIIKAPVIALFCSIINESRLVAREQTEAVKDFCKRVCKQFDLPYTDRVRQNFSNNPTKRNAEKLTQEVLPLIPENERQKLLAVLESKTQLKQKLYV